jgi:hypothetical protein
MGVVPVEMSRERFEELVAEALDEVPEEVLNLMSNVVILVEDESPEDGPELLGLYEGHALTSRGWDYAGVLPDRRVLLGTGPGILDDVERRCASHGRTGSNRPAACGDHHGRERALGGGARSAACRGPSPRRRCVAPRRSGRT